MLKPGQIFAERYRIEAFLAQGGMGAVFVAEHMVTEQRVALKVLRPHVLTAGDVVAKFQQEARIAARVDSENIVAVFDAGFDAATGMPFLVMELLRGETLSALVKSRGALPAATATRYLRQVASALDRAHAHVDRAGELAPIVHRDLKPDNLFVCHREDGEPRIKVLDFGIAKVLSAQAKASVGLKGTPAYMACEQITEGQITPQTDIWPLGLIAFYLLTGRSFWRTVTTSTSAAAVLSEVLVHPAFTPSQRAQELGLPPLPGGFDTWFLRCVHPVPSARFETAGAAIDMLESVLQGEAQAVPSTSIDLPSSDGRPTSTTPLRVLLREMRGAETLTLVAPRPPDDNVRTGAVETPAAPAPVATEADTRASPLDQGGVRGSGREGV